MNRNYLGLLALAGTTSTFFITGCASPVAERVVVTETAATSGCAATEIQRVRSVRRLEPVGERLEIRRTIWRTRPDEARYYNPMTQNFEGRWPFGPYNSSRN